MEGVVRRAVEEEVGVGVGVGAVAEGACDAAVLWGVPLRMQKAQVHDAAEGDCGDLGAVERRTEDVGGPAGVHMGVPGRELRLCGGIPVRRVRGSRRVEEDRAVPEGHDTALEQRGPGHCERAGRLKSLVSQGVGVGVEEGEEGALPRVVLGWEPHLVEGAEEGEWCCPGGDG